MAAASLTPSRPRKKAGEHRVAQLQPDQVGDVAGDRLHQAVAELEGADDEGILLCREVELLLERRRQDAQGVAVDVVDHGAQHHQGKDLPPQTTDLVHLFLTCLPRQAPVRTYRPLWRRSSGGTPGRRVFGAGRMGRFRSASRGAGASLTELY